MSDFLSAERYAFGPWSYFERAIGRLLIHKGWQNVQIVGKTGDRGGDIIASLNGEEWVIQVKHSGTNRDLTVDIVGDVANAMDYFGIEKGLCISNRNLGPAQQKKLGTFTNSSYKIQTLTGKSLLNAFDQLNEWIIDDRQPRPYQEECINELIASYKSGSNKGMICLATGMGKTFVACQFLKWLFEKDKNLNVLILAEMESLIEQFEQSLWTSLPKTVTTNLLTGKKKPHFMDGVLLSTFGSIDSFLSENQDLIFDILIIDEAHHSRARTYENSINQLNPRYTLGLTATPFRKDRLSLNNLFGEALVYYNVSRGIKKGYLAEVDYRMKGNNIDIDWIPKKSKKGYTIKQLNKKLFIPVALEKICEEFIAYWKKYDRQSGIFYCHSVEHATRVEKIFRSTFSFPAASFTNKNKVDENARRLRLFRNGRLKVLIAYDKLNEGVDVPNVDILCYGRVTHSRTIFLQQLGRGLRLKTDKKRKLLVLDYVDDLRRIGAVQRIAGEIQDESNNDIEVLKLDKGFQLSYNDKSTQNFIDLVEPDAVELDEEENEDRLIQFQ